MNTFDCFKTDAKAEVEGVWVKVPRSKTGAEVRVARLGNDRAREALRRLYRESQDREKFNPDDRATAAKLMSETVLVDWRNVTVDGVENVPYTSALGEKFLADPNYHEFFDFVRDAALARESYLAKCAEEATGK